MTSANVVLSKAELVDNFIKQNNLKNRTTFIKWYNEQFPNEVNSQHLFTKCVAIFEFVNNENNRKSMIAI